ncbi:MAG: hypothetical protein EOO67_00160 [Microbacterium sp.]|nr:MAG: hypothetical protein EOO67_00160 [Microbacterium sp.]
MADRAATLVVDPDHTGHHFQSVSFVVEQAARTGPVVLLTSRGASATDEFAAHLGDQHAAGRLEVVEALSGVLPGTADVARAVAETCRTRPEIGHVLVMDGDQPLKRWWRVAPPALEGLAPRPRVTFMLTRYPARLLLTDWSGWRLRVPKATLALVARVRGCLDRVVGFSGRDDVGNGLVVRRIGDPNDCAAHGSERARWRSELDLPADALLVGVFGFVSERRNAPMILEAVRSEGLDVLLVIAGSLTPEVRAWVDGLDEHGRSRLLVRDAYLDNPTLDRYIAAMDAIPLLLTNNGPSGIMGKAESAGVPVVTAGSVVRAREARALGAGEACDLDVASVGRALRTVLAPGYRVTTRDTDLVSPARYARAMLGLPDPDGRA